ncbi:hypothetical protein VTK56DRAFT_1870 [Thermocarpiscus australiensis]
MDLQRLNIDMSVTSSSPSPSPQQSPSRPRKRKVCLPCRGAKKACNKALPCDRCAKDKKNCVYEEDLPPGSVVQGQGTLVLSLYALISWDVHCLASRTVLDILRDQQSVKQAVSCYFEGVNTWFTIIDQASFEAQLESVWKSPSAEPCVLGLCMSMIARPPDLNSSSGMRDSVYFSAKTLLSLVESKLPMTTQLLQAELLVALYESCHSMPEQAYLSLGRCLHMTRVLGWHNREFWFENRQGATPGTLKLASILWWAIVFVDVHMYVGYQQRFQHMYPMHTANLGLDFVIPFPENFDQYFPGALGFQPGDRERGIRDANSDKIDGMVLPEAKSAWYLSSLLQQSSSLALSPTVNPTMNRSVLDAAITQHSYELSSSGWKTGERSGAVATNFIAMMKLHELGLFAVRTESVAMIQYFIKGVLDKATAIAQSDAGLSTGGLAPCWAFAIYYAASLLISYGNGLFQDENWPLNVGKLSNALEVISKRWKIAERYCEDVNILLNNYQSGYSG